MITMNKYELIEVNELKKKIVKFYTSGEELTEGDRMLNKVFDAIDELAVIELAIPKTEGEE